MSQNNERNKRRRDNEPPGETYEQWPMRQQAAPDKSLSSFAPGRYPRGTPRFRGRVLESSCSHLMRPIFIANTDAGMRTSKPHQILDPADRIRLIPPAELIASVVTMRPIAPRREAPHSAQARARSSCAVRRSARDTPRSDRPAARRAKCRTRPRSSFTLSTSGNVLPFSQLMTVSRAIRTRARRARLGSYPRLRAGIRCARPPWIRLAAHLPPAVRTPRTTATKQRHPHRADGQRDPSSIRSWQAPHPYGVRGARHRCPLRPLYPRQHGTQCDFTQFLAYKSFYTLIHLAFLKTRKTGPLPRKGK